MDIKKISIGNDVLNSVKTGKKVCLFNYYKVSKNDSLWESIMMALLKFAGVSNKFSSKIYKYILDHFDFHTHQLDMNNKQIQSNFIRENGEHISLHSVVNAVSKLENLRITNNDLPFMEREQYGKHGEHSYFLLNPILLPKNYTHYQGIAVYFSNVDSYRDTQKNINDKRIDYLNKKVKRLTREKTKTEKELKRAENHGYSKYHFGDINGGENDFH